VVIDAACHGHISVLDYVVQGEVLSAEVLTKALNCTGAFEQVQAAQWLRQHGAQWPALLGAGAYDDQLWIDSMLEWARGRRLHIA
jgi:hypothetical protein